MYKDVLSAKGKLKGHCRQAKQAQTEAKKYEEYESKHRKYGART
jgi:hypothetical protein